MRPWSPSHSRYAAWKFQAPEGELAHILTWNGTEDIQARQQSLLVRVFCHALIDLIPEEALHETLDALKEVFEFHIAREQVALPSSPTRLSATVGRVYERPDFYAVED
jgi:hypothetical protein